MLPNYLLHFVLKRQSSRRAYQEISGPLPGSELIFPGGGQGSSRPISQGRAEVGVPDRPSMRLDLQLPYQKYNTLILAVEQFADRTTAIGLGVQWRCTTPAPWASGNLF